MTVGAVLGDVSMFVNERPLVLHMATSAERLGGYTLEIIAVGRVVWIVAVGADHFVLRDRMMGELGELHLDLGVAAGTELFLIMSADFLLWPFVQFVAIEAADIVQRMRAGIPAGQVWS